MRKKLIKIFDQRMYTLFINVVSSLVFRFVNLGTTAVMVPLTVKYLSVEQYAIFAVVLSSSIIFTYADLGLGLGIVNKVADEQYQYKKRDISTVFFLLVFISIICLCSSIFYLSFLSDIKDTNSSNFFAWLAFFIISSIAIPISLSSRILFALQKVHEANVWRTVGRMLALAGVAFSGMTNQPLWIFIFSVTGIPLIVNFIMTASVFFRFPQLCPKISAVKFKEIYPLFLIGSGFLILQLVVFTESGIDVILLNYFMDPDTVREYDVIAKLYIYIPALMSVVLFPLWPAIKNALSEGDDVWVKKVAIKTFYIILSTALFAGFTMFYWCADIILLWTGVNISFDPLIIANFSLFSVLTSIGTLQNMLLNGYNMIAIQVKIGFVFGGLLIIGKIVALNSSGLFAMGLTLNSLYIFKLLYLNRFILNKKGIS